MQWTFGGALTVESFFYEFEWVGLEQKRYEWENDAGVWAGDVSLAALLWLIYILCYIHITDEDEALWLRYRCFKVIRVRNNDIDAMTGVMLEGDVGVVGSDCVMLDVEMRYDIYWLHCSWMFYMLFPMIIC